MPGRIIPVERQSLDYELWNRLNALPTIAGATTDEDEIYQLWRSESGKQTHTSSLWKKEGRDLDSIMVIDFIGLSLPLAGWFTYVNLNEDSLIEQIQEEIEGDELFSGILSAVDRTWLDLNWEVLGRVVGSALAHIGNSQGWWSNRGGVRKSHNFWMDVLKTLDSRNAIRDALAMWNVGDDISISLEKNRILEDEWGELIDFWKQRNLDPSAEVHRAAGHRPSAPFFSAPIRGTGAPAIAVNPLALRHQFIMRYLFQNMDNPGRFEECYGELVFASFRYYIDRLVAGDYVGFILGMHGLCANHLDRSDRTEMMTGMRLFTNLGIRRSLRDVHMLNVPDLANSLRAPFTLSRVLPLLADNNLIRWITIPQSDVAAACTAMGI